MSLSDLCEKRIELLVGVGVIGAVLELEHLPKALAVLPQDILASWLSQKLCWKKLKNSVTNLVRELYTSDLQFHHNVSQPHWNLPPQEEVRFLHPLSISSVVKEVG